MRSTCEMYILKCPAEDFSTMKYFIVLSSIIIAVSALPAELLSKEAAIQNLTRVSTEFQAGFATLNGGTRGGAGGSVWTVWDPWALRDAISSDEPRIVYVRGRIDLTLLFTGSPGVSLRVGNFKTIVGGDNNAMIFGGGLKLFHSRQVIIQNIKFHNALSYAPSEQPDGNGGIISQVAGAWSTIDCIDIEASENVWVNHCEFADDPWNSAATPDNRRRHDGLIDMKHGANLISISNNIFRNHNLAMLVGSSDSNADLDVGKLKVTYYGNWFMGTTQRNPRVRFGEVHVYNNLYTDIIDYGVGVGAGALVYVEKNLFINCRRAWGFASGVPNPAGYLLNVENLLQSSSFESGIPNDVRWAPSQYYEYYAFPANAIESNIRQFAGVFK